MRALFSGDVVDERSAEYESGSSETMRQLSDKAQLMLVAVLMETGAKVEIGKFAAIQLAVLRNLVEVHNASLRTRIRLPESREVIIALMDAEHDGAGIQTRSALDVLGRADQAIHVVPRLSGRRRTRRYH